MNREDLANLLIEVDDVKREAASLVLKGVQSQTFLMKSFDLCQDHIIPSLSTSTGRASWHH